MGIAGEVPTGLGTRSRHSLSRRAVGMLVEEIGYGVEDLEGYKPNREQEKPHRGPH